MFSGNNFDGTEIKTISGPYLSTDAIEKSNPARSFPSKVRSFKVFKSDSFVMTGKWISGDAQFGSISK